MTRKAQLKIFFLSLIILLGLLACGTTSSADNTGSADTNTSQSTATTTTTQAFNVGDVVKVGSNWQVTVNGVKTNTGDEFDQPKTGDVYIEIDISLKNLSSQEQDVSSELNFTLADSTGQKYDQTIVSSAPASPDGKVEANSVLRGTLVYEIPSSQKQFQLAFAPDITDSGQTVWNLTVK